MPERQRFDLTEYAKAKITVSPVAHDRLRGWLGVVFGEPDAEPGPLLVGVVDDGAEAADPVIRSTLDLGE